MELDIIRRGCDFVLRGVETDRCIQWLQQMQAAGKGPGDATYDLLRMVYGISRPAEVLYWPLNVRPRIAFDLSHAAMEGECKKNFQLISLIVEHHNAHFWSAFSKALSEFLKFNRLTQVGNITNWDYWNLSLNMHSKMISTIAARLTFQHDHI